MKIIASAPNRIDFAGGTTDIYPLYLFLNGGLTVNCAISLRSYVEIEIRNDNKIKIFSHDLNEKKEAANLKYLNIKEPLSFLAAVVKFMQPKTGINLTTYNEAPKGSGLGASSALLVALLSALNKLREKPFVENKLIQLAANLEAKAISIPTGKQDYYAAYYGGINKITFDDYQDKIESLFNEETKNFLENNLILSFTGISHSSAKANWEMVKNFIDNKNQAKEHLQKIKTTAEKILAPLKNACLHNFARIINEEWENRKKMGKGITTPKVEKLMDIAIQNGALANKLCGAGGGGCMLTIVPFKKRKIVAEVLTKNNAKVLNFKVEKEGLKIKQIN